MPPHRDYCYFIGGPLDREKRWVPDAMRGMRHQRPTRSNIERLYSASSGCVQYTVETTCYRALRFCGNILPDGSRCEQGEFVLMVAENICDKAAIRIANDAYPD
jgi:hypothetical protein